jgi:hypothetical protein
MKHSHQDGLDLLATEGHVWVGRFWQAHGQLSAMAELCQVRVQIEHATERKGIECGQYRLDDGGQKGLHGDHTSHNNNFDVEEWKWAVDVQIQSPQASTT